MTAGWRLHLPGPPGLLFHFVLAGDGVLFGPGGDAHPIAPLHLAVASGRRSQEIVELLLEGGADVNAKDLGGRTPLDYRRLDR